MQSINNILIRLKIIIFFQIESQKKFLIVMILLKRNIIFEKSSIKSCIRRGRLFWMSLETLRSTILILVFYFIVECTSQNQHLRMEEGPMPDNFENTLSR